MNYKEIKVILKTDKTRDYLWKKINTPRKVFNLENFKNISKLKKLSENVYKFYFGKRFGFLTFFPSQGVSMTFVENDDTSVAWFEIKGDKNCRVVHGTSVRVDLDKAKWYKENKLNVKEHFKEELKKWSY